MVEPVERDGVARPGGLVRGGRVEVEREGGRNVGAARAWRGCVHVRAGGMRAGGMRAGEMRGDVCG